LALEESKEGFIGETGTKWAISVESAFGLLFLVLMMNLAIAYGCYTRREGRR